MLGFFMAILSGAAMSLQGVMNTRLSDQIGLYESNLFVQGTAFALSALALIIFGKGNFSAITSVPPLYLFGGALGVVITVTVIASISNLSPAVAISVILISQLFVAAMIDAFGIMGSEKTAFTWNKYLGLLMMIGGVILFKWKTA